ncbi:hypothetical protein DES53_101263 [Roseimicrobium gellanilyticum]|uniref:Lipoprotein n=2 Tax=Roseimicrobium gellanilyticum TaxID=748857 RepID=A0A366HT59_9BACT|nr:hypothetical protein DES53_101263 [Roseimicrobium gellanilyticum]
MASRFAFLFCLLLPVAGCTWNAADRDATLAHFKAHRGEYQALLESVGKDPAGDLSRYQAVLKSIEVQPTTPPIVEVTPIDFYYVLVHAGDEASLAVSDAMRDEGRVLKDLGDGWYLVQRGFM